MSTSVSLAFRAAPESPHFPPVLVHRRPQVLHSEGSLRGAPVSSAWLWRCPPAAGPHSRAAFLSPRASDPHGPAASRTISLATQPGPATFLALQVGPCQLQGTLEQLARDKAYGRRPQSRAARCWQCVWQASKGASEVVYGTRPWASRIPASERPEAGQYLPPRSSHDPQLLFSEHPECRKN